MKLTIDTQVDTHEDIRKILQILTSILEKKEPFSSSAPVSSDTTNLMSMFSDNNQQETGTVETKGSPPDFSSFLNLTAQKKESKNNDDSGRIEYY